MHKLPGIFQATGLLLMCSLSAYAQNTFPSSGNVGIGTATPARNLQVVGTGDSVVAIGEADNNGGKQIVFGVDTSGNGYGSIQALYQGHAYDPLIFNMYGGNVGIGGTAPMYKLDIFTPTIDGVDTYSGLQIRSNNYGYVIEGGIKQNAGGVLKFSTNNNSIITERMRLDSSGRVGIGTSSPAYPLDVAGQIRSTGGMVFADGTSQTTAFIPANCGADYAESVEVTGERTKYEPGDVLVIDPSTPGKFLKSNQSYSTLVAGIYSTQPGFVGRLHPKTAETDKVEVPMAMIGRVPTKVSTENGPIKVGDLLVTSSTLGYAMKGSDRSLLTGAIVGKALGSLDSGLGVIEVLVTLQ